MARMCPLDRCLPRVLVALTALALIAGVVCVPLGCAGSRAAQAGDASYVEQFARGDYAAAKGTALAQASRSSGIEKDRANLIAGLSAAQLGQNAEASRLLSPLTSHSDSEIAGRATAGAGLVARNQGERAKGASLLAQGAHKLSGDSAAKAYMAAGDTYAEIGAREQAMAQYNAGMGAAQSSDLKSSLQERLAGKRYTVQFGVYSNRANADRRVGEVRAKASSVGLGIPRVVTTTTRGQTAYAVQAGDFASKREARSASLQIGQGALVAEVDLK